MSEINITNEDNMELMKRYPDNYFELAIVDVPYGSDNIQGGYKLGNSGGKGAAKQKVYNKAIWKHSAPDIKYFNELFRVSKNQIIWGANHFISKMPIDSPCWIIWDKKNGNTKFADCELAWASFNKAARKFEFMWNGMLQGDMKNKEERIHPTQKPVKLYEWLLVNYAKEGDKILDTNLGSGSIAIACHNLKFDLTACELDKDYYDAAILRLRIHRMQKTLF